MMKRLIPPLCLLIAFSMIVVAICLLAVGAPEASVELQQAQATNNETFSKVWEADLLRRQRTHLAMIVGLLIGSVVMTVNAFRSMR